MPIFATHHRYIWTAPALCASDYACRPNLPLACLSNGSSEDKVSFRRTQQESSETCNGKSNLPNRKSLVARGEEKSSWNIYRYKLYVQWAGGRETDPNSRSSVDCVLVIVSCTQNTMKFFIAVGLVPSSGTNGTTPNFWLVRIICILYHTMMHGTMNIKEGIQFSNGVGPGK